MEELQIKIIETICRFHTDCSMFYNVVDNIGNIVNTDVKAPTKTKKINKEKARLKMFHESQKAYFNLLDGVLEQLADISAQIAKLNTNIARSRNFLKKLRKISNQIESLNPNSSKKEIKTLRSELKSMEQYMEEKIL